MQMPTPVRWLHTGVALAALATVGMALAQAPDAELDSVLSGTVPTADALPPPAAAPTAASPDTVSTLPVQPVAARRNGITIEEIVVTAEKREEGVNDVPIAISAYSGELLEELGVTDTRDLGNLVPGFSYADGGFGTPIYTLRGVGFNENSGSASSTVGIYMDEFNLPFPVMSKGANLDIQRVEVLKGPQGTLYGRNTTGGAISYITNKPTEELLYGFSAGYSSYQTAEAEGFVSGPIADVLRARLAYKSTQSADGWQHSRTRHPDSEAYNGDTGRNIGGQYSRFGYDSLGKLDKQAGRLLLDWLPADAFKLGLTLSYTRDRSEPQALQVLGLDAQSPFDPGPTSPGYNSTLHPDVANYPLNSLNTHDAAAADYPNVGIEYRLHDTFYSAGLRGEYQLTDTLGAVALGSVGQFKSDGTFIPQSGVDTINTERNVFNTTRYFNSELRFVGNASDRIFWQVGAHISRDRVMEYQRLHHDTISVVGPVDSPEGDGVAGVDNRSGFDGTQTALVKALFANSNWSFLDTLKLTLGLRYTHEKRDFNGCARDVNIANRPGASQDAPGSVDEGPGLAATFTGLSAAQSPAAGYTPGTAQPGGCVTLDYITRRPQRFFGKLAESNVSGRLALDWKPTDTMLYYASYSRGFKSGSFPLINISDSFQFAPATQERLDAFELGSKLTLLEGLIQLNAAVFHYNYKDKQLVTNFRDQVFGPLPVLRNAPKSRVDGAELDLKWTPLDGLFLSGAFSYLDTKVKQFVAGDANGADFDFAGKPFTFTSPIEFTLLADYTLPFFEKFKVSLGADYSYTDATNSTLGRDPRFDIPAYSLVNTRLKVADPDGHWAVSVFGRNVLDKYYYNNVTNQTDTVGRYTGMPRSFGMTVGWHL